MQINWDSHYMLTRPIGYMDSCPIVPRPASPKIEEANGTPVWKAKEEGGTPDIEATGRTLAQMQTVVMSFGRNQSLGKPDLPKNHLRVYFPVQLVMAARAVVFPQSGK